ncbi:hypothetical protein D3C72_1729350 [compost metagenome]
MLAFHHVQADGLVLDGHEQADGFAGRRGQRRHVRLRFVDQEGRLVKAPGQLHAERPRPVLAFVLGDESPALEQRHLPVEGALRQAGLLGQRGDAERAVVPGQGGQHIQDAIRARPYRRIRHNHSTPSNMSARLSIYGVIPFIFSHVLRIARENPESRAKKNPPTAGFWTGEDPPQAGYGATGLS